MECKCQYYTMVNGALVCSVCGKPSPKSKPAAAATATKIEDKVLHAGIENKGKTRR